MSATAKKLVRFADVAEIVTGSTPPTSERSYYGGTIPFVGPSELGASEPLLHSPKTLTSEGAAKSRLLPADAVLVCCIGATIGKVGIAGIPLATNQQINALIFDQTKVFPRYAFHFCKTLQPLMRARGASTTLPIMNKSDFGELRIPVLPLPEQKRIAAILDKADAIRRKRQQAIRLTEELLRSAFLEMFGDPVTNPKGWEVKKLGVVCTKVTDGTHQSPKFVAQGIPFLFISNILGGRIDFETKKFISRETWAELTRSTPIEQGDILYATVGSYGNAVLVEDPREFAFQRHIAHIKPDPQKFNPRFLLSQLESPAVRHQVDGLVRGVAQKTLNLGDLKQVRVLVPPMPAQEQFVALGERAARAIRRGLDYTTAALGLSESLTLHAFSRRL